MAKMIDVPERRKKLSSVFLELGCQYYASARFCASQFYMPICATLFHHAIEMLLKGYLIRFEDSAELKKTGHYLVTLWSMFTSANGDTGLHKFDKAISDLDQVELLRYPDKMVDEGFVLNVRLGVTSPTQLPGLENHPQYFVNVSDLDAIAMAIFTACKVNPKLGFRNAPSEFVLKLPPEFQPW